MSEPFNPVWVCAHCRSVFRGHYARCPRDGQVLESGTQDILPGTTLGHGKYLVRHRLGEGGAGMVYEAIDPRLNRRYAIKVLYGDLAVFPDMLRRFRREAEAAGRLSHPNVAGVVDFGLDAEDEPAFLVMELAEGQSLATVVYHSGPMPEARARLVLDGISQGLAHAHARGVLHRDLKPDNIILEVGTDRPRIVDFGVARLESTSSQAKLTHHGIVVGTPGFLAPEVLRGLPPDARSDLYGLGITAFYLLTARLPFSGPEDEIITRTLAGVDLRPLDQASVSQDLRELVRGLVAAQPDERPASALAFAAQLAGRAPKPAASSGPGAFAPTRPSIALRPKAAPRAEAPPRPDSPRPEPHEVAPTVAVMMRPAEGPARPGMRRRTWTALALGLTLVGLGGLVGAWWPDAGVGPRAAGSSVGGTAPAPDPRPAPSPAVPAETTPAPPPDLAPRAARLVLTASASVPAPAQQAPPAAAVRAAPPLVRRAPVQASLPSAAAPVNAKTLSEAYARLGRSLDGLESEQGAGAAGALRERYFDLPIADALRRPELGEGLMRRIRALEREVQQARAKKTARP